MSPFRLLLWSAALLLPLAVACTPDTPPPQPTTEVRAGDLIVRYRLPGGELPLNQPFSVVIAIERTDGPLPATTPVRVDARMPAHNHGMPVQPMVVPIEPGLWRADPMLFQMPGHWQLYVSVGAAPSETTATFDIQLRP